MKFRWWLRFLPGFIFLLAITILLNYFYRRIFHLPPGKPTNTIFAIAMFLTIGFAVIFNLLRTRWLEKQSNGRKTHE